LFSHHFDYVCNSLCLAEGDDDDCCAGAAEDTAVAASAVDDNDDVGGGERKGNEGCTKRTRSASASVTKLDPAVEALAVAALNADVKAVAAQRVW